MTTKQLKYFAFVLLMLGMAINTTHAQICEPDTTLDSLGVFPSIPPAATVGQPYNQTLNAAIPKELTIPFQGGNITLDICSAEITGTEILGGNSASSDTSLANIGVTFDCNVPDCIIDIDHSQSNPFAFACIVVEGTPTATVDSIKVLLKAGLGGYNETTDVCAVNLQFDTSLVVGLVIQADSSTTGITASQQADFTWHYDAQQSQLTLNRQATATTAQASVMNLQGQELIRRDLEMGTSQWRFSTADWPSGIYLMRLRDQNGAIQTRKIRVQ